jgi:beta-N-acetylhexosaminidase
VLRAILRTWLGFKGLILTDSLTAGAISGAHLSVPKAAVLSLNGGADMVLLGAQANATADMALAQQVSNAIVGAVQHGTLRRTTLQSDVSYILATKASLHC